MKPKLPKYWRPATIPFATRLNETAMKYVREQAVKYEVTQLMWLNLLLTKMAKDGKNFDPRAFVPTDEELVAVSLEKMTKQAREKAGEINYAAVDRKRPRRPRRHEKDFEV